MSSWVKCTRSAGGTPIFVNLEQVRMIAQEAPGVWIIKFNHGAEVEVEEAPEDMIGGFRDASREEEGKAEQNGSGAGQLDLQRRTLVGRANRRLPS